MTPSQKSQQTEGWQSLQGYHARLSKESARLLSLHILVALLMADVSLISVRCGSEKWQRWHSSMAVIKPSM